MCRGSEVGCGVEQHLGRNEPRSVLILQQSTLCKAGMETGTQKCWLEVYRESSRSEEIAKTRCIMEHLDPIHTSRRLGKDGLEANTTILKEVDQPCR